MTGRRRGRERRRIAVVTGTRAEFGLLGSTLRALRDHPKAQLQLVVTGMHLLNKFGRTEQQIIGECLRELIEFWFERGEFERIECMELLFVLGWANKAAAQRLGISEQAVANHKSFVVKKLKETARRSRLSDLNLADFGISES